MAINPAIRPRVPQVRGVKRHVAELSFLPDYTPAHRIWLEEPDEIEAPLGLPPEEKGWSRTTSWSIAWAHALERLPVIAAEYHRRRQQPDPRRGETRYQLSMLAHLVWKLDHADGAGDAEPARRPVVSWAAPHPLQLGA